MRFLRPHRPSRVSVRSVAHELGRRDATVNRLRHCMDEAVLICERIVFRRAVVAR